MKSLKFIIPFMIFVLTASLAGAAIKENTENEMSDELLTSLIKCTPYKESQKVQMLGTYYNYVTQVRGVSNGRCVYVTYIAETPAKSRTVCRFSGTQLKQIAAAAKKSRQAKEKYSATTTGYASAPISVLLTKFLNDPSSCKLP